MIIQHLVLIFYSEKNIVHFSDISKKVKSGAEKLFCFKGARFFFAGTTDLHHRYLF